MAFLVCPLPSRPKLLAAAGQADTLAYDEFEPVRPAVYELVLDQFPRIKNGNECIRHRRGFLSRCGTDPTVHD